MCLFSFSTASPLPSSALSPPPPSSFSLSSSLKKGLWSLYGIASNFGGVRVKRRGGGRVKVEEKRRGGGGVKGEYEEEVQKALEAINTLKKQEKVESLFFFLSFFLFFFLFFFLISYPLYYPHNLNILFLFLMIMIL